MTARTRGRDDSAGALRRERSGFVVTVRGRGRPASRWLDSACVATLVVAVLIQGVVSALDLPHRVTLLGDLAALILLVWALVEIWRRGASFAVPYLALAFALVVAIGAVGGADDPVRMLVSARNFLMLPVLAVALAALGTVERRNQLVVLAVVGLGVVEFGVTIYQSLTASNIDLVVGTFGDNASANTAFGVVAASALALAVYVARTGGSLWLVIAMALPLFSIWAAVRNVVIIAPLVAACVGLSSLAAGDFDGRWSAAASRVKVALAAALAMGVTLAGGYALFRPYDFQLFTNLEQQARYLQNADIVGTGASGSHYHKAQTVPGRLAQYKTAFGMIDDDPVSLVAGNGLGTTTYAENIGVAELKSKDARSAGLSDFGTLVVELGVLGVTVVGVCAVALGVASARAARSASKGSWTRAFLVGYPGVVLAMAWESFFSTPFRNVASATIFWVLTGLALAAVLSRTNGAGGPALET